MNHRLTPAHREKDRKEIADLVAAFKAAGKNITTLPNNVHQPKGRKFMTKILVGLVTRDLTNKKNVMRILAEHLNLKHQSIEAPLLNAMAAVTGIDVLTLSADETPFTVIDSVNCTISNLKSRFKHVVEMNQPDFLINELKKSIYSSESQRINSTFGGNLVSDVNNEKQADFIRKNNGIVVHIFLENSRLPHPVPPQKNDLIITFKNSDPAPEHIIFQYCKVIKSRYENREFEAA